MPPLLSSKERFEHSSPEERSALILELCGRLGPSFVPGSLGSQSELASIVHSATGLEFLAVPAGTFSMGMSEEDLENLSEYVSFGALMDALVSSARPRALPVHQVTVRPFLMTRDVLGPAEIQAMVPSPSFEIAREGEVAWVGVEAALSRKLFRLPSEAELEWVGRNGGEFSLINDCARHYINPDEPEDPDSAFPFPETSAWGFRHLYLEQWVADGWHPDYEGAPTDGTPWIDDRADGRMVRGRLCKHGPEEGMEDLFYALASLRHPSPATRRNHLRLALDMPE